MKLRELFADKFLDFVEDSPLFEMAWSRREAERKVTGLGDPILKHLIKILKWDDTINYQKHCNDIDNWLNQIQNITLKIKKPLEAKVSYKWLVLDQNFSEKTIDRWIKNLIQYDNLNVISSNEDVYLNIINIMQEVCRDLELNKFENIENYL